MAASSLSGTLSVLLKWLNAQPTDLGDIEDSSELNYSQNFSDGVSGSLVSHLAWGDTRTLAAGANDDLDLNALTLAIFAATETVNFTNIRAIVIQNQNAVTGDKLNLDSSLANSFLGWANGSATSKAEIGPQSPFVAANMFDGWAVTPATAHLLRIHNPSAHTITYQIAIIGY